MYMYMYIKQDYMYLTCSLTGSVVGLTIAFCTTATRTRRGGRICSLAAPIRHILISKFFSSASFWALAGTSSDLQEIMSRVSLIKGKGKGRSKKKGHGLYVMYFGIYEHVHESMHAILKEYC